MTVTDAAFRLIDGYFECEPGGEVKPRGAAAPVPVYRVKAERSVRNRMEAADPARLAPLVGRDREVALLRERWELAAEGVRNVILLVADPGLGKSRLVRVMKDFALAASGAGPLDSARSDSAGAAVVEWYCSPYHQASPFYPVTDYFERAYQLAREPDPAARLDRLLDRLRADGVTDPDDQALFAAMLTIPTGDRLPAPALSPERQKEMTQDALLGWLTARTEHAAVLFVVEDLHWVDPSTEALLARFVEDGGDARVLGLFTFRPEYDPPWKGGAVQTQVALNRLTRSQVGELIRARPAKRSSRRRPSTRSPSGPTACRCSSRSSPGWSRRAGAGPPGWAPRSRPRCKTCSSPGSTGWRVCATWCNSARSSAAPSPTA